MINFLHRSSKIICRSLITAVLLVMMLFFTNCGAQKKNGITSILGPDEYVFIEYFLTQDGEVISGIPPKGMRIDGPAYRFDKSSKQLSIHRNDNLVTDSIKVLLGNGKILKGAAGNGVSMRLTNITSLPYTENKFTINRIDSKNINFTFDNQKIKLKAGDEWGLSIFRTDTIKLAEPSIVKTKLTYTIRYHGKLSKNSITGL